MYDGTNVIKLSNNPGMHDNPQISGSNVVWEGAIGSRYEERHIYLYDGESVTNLSKTIVRDYPQISGLNVVWKELSRIQVAYWLGPDAVLQNVDLFGEDLSNINFTGANLSNVILYGANLTNASGVETSTGSPYDYPNTALPTGFDPVAKGWTLALYCDFSSDAVCGVVDINRMFEVGNLVTGVVTSSSTERFDLVDDDIIDAADITEWLSLAATEIEYDAPFSRGVINLDHDVDTRDLTAMIIGFTSAGGTGKTWNTGDTDGDGNVDSADLTTAIINFTSARNAAAAVPEPSSLLLLVLAVGCLAAAGNRNCRR